MDGSKATTYPTDAAVLVCERTGAWAARLRRELPDRVQETRTLEQCHDAMAECERAFVVLEVHSDNLSRVVDLIMRISQGSRHAAAAVGTRVDLASQALLREAGALHVLDSGRELPKLAALIRRWTDQLLPPTRTLREAAWRALPWAEVARVRGGGEP